MKTQSASQKKQAWALQAKICDRAHSLGIEHDRQSLMMDLHSVTDLDLELLLSFPNFDFCHDVCGIMRHMDRRTYPGKLTDFFVPRACR